MAIKRCTGSAMTDCSAVRRYTNNGWQACTIAKRYDGNQWIDLLPSGSGGQTIAQVKTYTHTLTTSTDVWTYIKSGSGYVQQPAHLHEPIHGAYNGSSTARKSILLLPDLRSTLAGATIKSVRLHLSRLSTSHGETTGTVCIKSRSLGTHPNTYSAGTEGQAYAGGTTLKRGQSAWITLHNTVGNGLQDGTIKSLVLDAGTNYAVSRYIKYGNTIKLEIIYET